MIARILREHGVEPAPQRRKGMSWATFLKSHWDVLAATDLFTVEVMTVRGLVRHHVLFVLKLSTRIVEIARIVRETPVACCAQDAVYWGEIDVSPRGAGNSSMLKYR